MEMRHATSSLSALAHEGRLSIFRELIRAGGGGLPAGEIARRLEILPNTLSASLTVLAHAGLVASRRQGRSIIYTALYERMAELLAFLVEDCCSGSPTVCTPLLSIVSKTSCCAAETAQPAEETA